MSSRNEFTICLMRPSIKMNTHSWKTGDFDVKKKVVLFHANIRNWIQTKCLQFIWYWNCYSWLPHSCLVACLCCWSGRYADRGTGWEPARRGPSLHPRHRSPGPSEWGPTEVSQGEARRSPQSHEDSHQAPAGSSQEGMHHFIIH